MPRAQTKYGQQGCVDFPGGSDVLRKQPPARPPFEKGIDIWEGRCVSPLRVHKLLTAWSRYRRRIFGVPIMLKNLDETELSIAQSRSNESTAALVERGISLIDELGPNLVAAFLTERGVLFGVVVRVLAEPQRRRQSLA